MKETENDRQNWEWRILQVICESGAILDSDTLRISEEVHLVILQAVGVSYALKH